jgi:hypothetical protein
MKMMVFFVGMLFLAMAMSGFGIFDEKSLQEANNGKNN